MYTPFDDFLPRANSTILMKLNHMKHPSIDLFKLVESGSFQSLTRLTSVKIFKQVLKKQQSDFDETSYLECTILALAFFKFVKIESFQSLTKSLGELVSNLLTC